MLFYVLRTELKSLDRLAKQSIWLVNIGVYLNAKVVVFMILLLECSDQYIHDRYVYVSRLKNSSCITK